MCLGLVYMVLIEQVIILNLIVYFTNLTELKILRIKKGVQQNTFF